jgi:hypothetical protein
MKLAHSDKKTLECTSSSLFVCLSPVCSFDVLRLVWLSLFDRLTFSLCLAFLWFSVRKGDVRKLEFKDGEFDLILDKGGSSLFSFSSHPSLSSPFLLLTRFVSHLRFLSLFSFCQVLLMLFYVVKKEQKTVSPLCEKWLGMFSSSTSLQSFILFILFYLPVSLFFSAY